MSWLRTVEDYLDAVPCSEQQAIVFVILLLGSTAREWWDAECISRGERRPESLEELKRLLRARFESPIRESRARTRLLKLSQKTGEDACKYMARTRSLLQRVPRTDEQTALWWWIYGLRQPFRFEAAMSDPKTLAEAEFFVARMEDVISGKADSDQRNERKKRRKHAGKSGRIVRHPSYAHTRRNERCSEGSHSGHGHAGQPHLSLLTGPHYHLGYQSRESGQSRCGRI